MQQPSFFKTLTQMSLKFLPLAVVIWFIVAWFELPRSASWGFAGVVMMYAFLLSLPPKKKTEISFGKISGSNCLSYYLSRELYGSWQGSLGFLSGGR